MEVQDQLDELENIIDTLDLLIDECKEKDNKDVLNELSDSFKCEYNELYEEIKNQNEDELAGMNYEFKRMRI